MNPLTDEDLRQVGLRRMRPDEVHGALTDEQCRQLAAASVRVWRKTYPGGYRPGQNCTEKPK